MHSRNEAVDSACYDSHRPSSFDPSPDNNNSHFTMVPRPSFQSDDEDIILDESQEQQLQHPIEAFASSTSALSTTAASVTLLNRKEHATETVASPQVLCQKRGKLRQRESFASFPVREIRFERLCISKQSSVLSASSTATTSATTVTTTTTTATPKTAPSTAESTSQQQEQAQVPQHHNTMLEAKQRERFAIFMKILFKILAQESSSGHESSQTLLIKAKRIVADCTKRNRQGDPKYESLMEVIHVQLRKLVGEKHWMKASVFLQHYYRSTTRGSAGRNARPTFPSNISAPSTHGGTATTLTRTNSNNHTCRQQPKIQAE